MQIAPRILPIKNGLNFRDLGGYKTKDKGSTKSGIFFRSAKTDTLSEEDIALLQNEGISLVLDLRSKEEVKRDPSKLSDRPEFNYNNIQILDNINAGFDLNNFPASMEALYMQVLEQANECVATIVNLFAEQIKKNKGGILFHCTAGKDRTGIVAMLLLDLAGVPKETIVEDYALTDSLIEPLRLQQMAFFKKMNIPVPEYALRAYKKSMEITLDYLYEEYGDANTYFLTCGAAQEEIDIIRTAFIEK